MLTDRECQLAEVKAKQYMLHDSDGLHLLVKPDGSRRWLMKYASGRKAMTYVIGQYGEPPDGVSLA